MARKKADREAFPGIFPTKTAAKEEVSPIALMSAAIEEHFEAADPHFCQAACTEDILIRMNARSLYIVSESTLNRLHVPCLMQIRWYRDALTSILDGNSLLKPEAVAKLALEHELKDSG